MKDGEFAMNSNSWRSLSEKKKDFASGTKRF